MNVGTVLVTWDLELPPFNGEEKGKGRGEIWSGVNLQSVYCQNTKLNWNGNPRLMQCNTIFYTHHQRKSSYRTELTELEENGQEPHDWYESVSILMLRPKSLDPVVLTWDWECLFQANLRNADQACAVRSQGMTTYFPPPPTPTYDIGSYLCVYKALSSAWV